MFKFFTSRKTIDKRKKYLKLPEVADILEISYSTALRILQDSKEGEGSFPYRRFRKNGDYYIPREEFLEWKRKHWRN